MKRFLTAFAAGVLLATGAVACGDDDEKASETTPTVTTETETAPTETAATATTPAPTSPRTTPAPPADPNSGGTIAPRTTPRSAPQDGPENDLPPEPGSPAERFEQQCERNPQTCGD